MQLSTKGSLLQGKKIATNSKERAMLTKSVTYWLAKDSLPDYAVEKSDLKRMPILDINILVTIISVALSYLRMYGTS